jgi:hypothetical protein
VANDDPGIKAAFEYSEPTSGNYSELVETLKSAMAMVRE